MCNVSSYSSGNKLEMCNVKLYVSAYIRLKNFVKSFGTLLFWNTTGVYTGFNTQHSSSGASRADG